MSESSDTKFDYGSKECFMAGYLVGLTTDERVSDDTMLEMFEKSSIKEIQALVKIIKEQLSEGLIEKDAAVKYLGKKFLAFAKKQQLTRIRLAEFEFMGTGYSRALFAFRRSIIFLSIA